MEFTRVARSRPWALFLTGARFVLAAGLLAAMTSAQQEILFSSSSDGTSYYAAPESSVTTTASSECADDFDVVGTVERLYVIGNGCFQCAPPQVSEVVVRFYGWTAGGPGALLQQQALPAGAPGLQYAVDEPSTLDITLPLPFEASGQHFVSVQVVFEGSGSWDWWVTHSGAPEGSHFWYREDGGAWGLYPHPSHDPFLADLSFLVWGQDDTPPPSGTDPNGTWRTVDVPDPAPGQRVSLRDVEVLAPDDVWAVGEYDQLVTPPYETDTRPLALHWDGTSWTQVSVPYPHLFVGGEHADLQAIAAAGPDDIWAAGGAVRQGPDGFVGLHLYVVHWDGSTWQMVPAPVTSGGSGNFIDDIEIVAPDDIWFVGDWLAFPPTSAAQKRALTMHWNGSSFAVVDNPFFDNNPIGGHGLTSISALASDDIWAVGGGHDGDYVDFSEIVHWNGSTWTHVPGPTPGWFHRLYAVEGIASDDVWACGDYDDETGYHALFLHWDGSAWTQVSSPGGGSGLVAFGPDEVYASGGGVVRWNGASWSIVEDFPSHIGVSTLAIDAAGTVDSLWTVGREELVGALKGFAARLEPGVPSNGFEPLGSGTMLLWGQGSFEPGTTVDIGLAGSEPLRTAVLVVGLSTIDRPFHGVTIVPALDLRVRGATAADGTEIFFSAPWPQGIPSGQELWLQGFVLGSDGLAASNALHLTAP